MPSPYPNGKTVRASNGGVLPPDLSGIVKAHRGAAVRVSDCDAVFRAFMRVRTASLGRLREGPPQQQAHNQCRGGCSS